MFRATRYEIPIDQREAEIFDLGGVTNSDVPPARQTTTSRDSIYLLDALIHHAKIRQAAHASAVIHAVADEKIISACFKPDIIAMQILRMPR